MFFRLATSSSFAVWFPSSRGVAQHCLSALRETGEGVVDYRKYGRGHPDYGWLTFLFPLEGASRLGMGIMKQPALCEYFAGTLPQSTVTLN
jgi:hypothetical protein